ncbi:DUF2523 domain-containing protein [Lysobacter sp. GX 14042]|uniref:DUF2523 family protein n=1 Tax=Lysobacter sp. GX 14042 TaxID=2907155 RepID=UPI001F20DAF0|nr:DUF2523 family protein [Lysobacter sp. GX 14042]MCE7031360.1 DUF2523 domain-containing protein [Lysobacter sp. GX 14042]
MIATAVRWVLIAHGAAIVARILGTLGLAFVTYQYVVEPVLNQLKQAVSTLPAEVLVWISALGLDKVISILASAYLIAAARNVVLGKRE